MSGSRVSKADLIRLARALGDVEDEIDEESMGCIFERCMQRAEQIGAPAPVYPLDHDSAHPIVRDWARRVIDAAVEHVQLCRMGPNEAERFAAGWVDSSVRKHAELDPATCSHTMRAGRCLRCGLSPIPSTSEAIDLMHRNPLRPLMLTEDRSAEQLQADGDDCDHAGAELAIDRATGEERCCECGAETRDRDDEERELQRENQRRQDTMANHCLHTLYDGSKPECPDCGQSLQAVVAEDRQRVLVEARDEDGARLDDWRAQRIEHVRGLLEAEPGRAERKQRGDERLAPAVGHQRLDSGELVRVSDRRENAEQWAKTVGSKGGATTA